MAGKGLRQRFLYATLYGIGTTLHSITGGEAEYSYEFLKYEVENKG